MKYLAPKAVDDHAVLAALSANPRLPGRAHIAAVSTGIGRQYDLYDRSGGDPFVVKQMALPPQVVNLLAAWYSNPPADISHISEYRNKASPSVCPMCGSPHTSTLDHFLPKSVYPEFHVYSRNLVPACSCNAKRSTTYIGVQAGERPLHPYYDRVLQSRLVRARLHPPFRAPRISIKICLLPRGRARALRFHVAQILARTNVLNWIGERWIAHLRRPHEILGLSKRIVTKGEVAQAIDAALDREDAVFETPNNWTSMFYAGVKANSRAIAFLHEHVNALHRGTIHREDI
jgi:hypothetical protein